MASTSTTDAPPTGSSSVNGLLGWACFLGSLVFLALVTAPFTGLCCFRSSCSTGRESRPFTCHFCPYAASLKHHLTRHLRRHTGKKPFQCAVCPAAFIRKDHLGIHMRKHTGEKPYRCTLCALAFSHRRSLVSHMQAHQAPPAYY
ncbi:uncharacterized protein LOC144176013 isoform X6 [Haemaphysalis longicornis]